MPPTHIDELELLHEIERQTERARQISEQLDILLEALRQATGRTRASARRRPRPASARCRPRTAF